MKLTRPALVITLVAALATTGATADAAKKKLKAPPCNQITDPKGDADIQGGVGNDEPLDLTSVDFGGDKKNLTVVARVSKASLKSAVFPAGSIKVGTKFTLADTKYFVSVISDGAEVIGYFGTVGPASNTVTSYPPAKIDLATNEFRISVPAADIGPALYKVGAVVSEVTTTSSAAVLKIPSVATTGGIGADSATNADYTYKVGTATCVTPGK